MKQLFYICCGLLLIACENHSPSTMIELSAKETRQVKEPIKVNIPANRITTKASHLVNPETSTVIPLQIDSDGMFVFLLDEGMEAGSVRKYKLEHSSIPISANHTQIKLKEDADAIQLEVDEKPVLKYNKSIQYPPKGSPAYYQRSGYIHPVYSPSGKIITDGFPKDHMHQHGVFFAWVNTEFRGQFTDFWNQHNQNGMVRHMSIEKTNEGPVFAEFVSWLEHLAIQNGDTIPVLKERWTVRVYAVASPFIIDFTSEQQMIGTDTLFLKEYRYGGFGIRGSAEWDDHGFTQPKDVDSAVNYIGHAGKGGFLTSEQKTRVDGNHTRPYWVDFHGTVEGEKLGILSMGHPSNFRFPQAVRIHPTMPYFCFAPMVTGSFEIKPEETYTSKYRCVVHDEHPSFDELDAWWKGYEAAAKISMTKN